MNAIKKQAYLSKLAWRTAKDSNPNALKIQSLKPHQLSFDRVARRH